MASVNVAKTDGLSPVILDLGKHKRKSIKDLRQGKGKLFNEVSTSVQEMRDTGTLSSASQPVIVVVRQKSKGWRKKMPRLV